ncbi:hypothetical protein MUK42_29976 [Musa troglodytarum]|uniref:Uncharacterized protein n=1 Tax=Musa troglodytarum TaxID=320322 RepID=A0A9E7JP08_9LILI|nr:hypothetical protein MUK42_29976 [Musa troglodytarum]
MAAMAEAGLEQVSDRRGDGGGVLGPPQRKVLQRARAAVGLLRRRGVRRRGRPPPRRPAEGSLPQDELAAVLDRGRLGGEEGARLR